MTLHLNELKVNDFFNVSNVWILHNICYENLNNSSSLFKKYYIGTEELLKLNYNIIQWPKKKMKKKEICHKLNWGIHAKNMWWWWWWQETKPNLPQREIYSFYQTVIEGASIPYLNTVKLWMENAVSDNRACKYYSITFLSFKMQSAKTYFRFIKWSTDEKWKSTW